jgi:hypothetical protein
MRTYKELIDAFIDIRLNTDRLEKSWIKGKGKKRPWIIEMNRIINEIRVLENNWG